jgi:methionyl-tRNA formyltransferase
MTPTSTKIIFFGTEDFSLTALTGLIEAGYDIAAVVTKPDSKRGRGQVLSAPSVKILAERHNIPVWQPTHLLDITDDVRALQPVAGVLVSYGKIVPQSIIDLFTPGIVNVHPSLLPKYRGPSPIESAILNGDDTTGVSIMQLSRAMDAGPVYAVKNHPLHHTETQAELYHTLAVVGTNLLLETLPAILDASLTPTDQDDSKAVYCALLKKPDALLDPQVLTATDAERRVRAYLNYPKARIIHGDASLIVTRAHVSPTKNTPLDVECKDGAFLVIDELISATGRRMSADAYLRGHLA